MTGTGISHGAVSVMNAIPCGIGSTIGIGLRTEARFEPSGRIEIELADRSGMDDSLARACVSRALESIGESVEGYRLTVSTQIPPSMGLKSSSSVCNAVIAAVLDEFGAEMDPLDAIRLGVECAKECGVTITGAFDDACGCGLGGLVVTDNSKNELLRRLEIPEYDVVVCLPDRTIPKSKVPVERYRELREEYESLVPRIEDGYLEVLTANGAFVESIVGRCGMAERALEAGALAAGITGTGPATAVIADPGDGRRIADELGCPALLTRTLRWTLFSTEEGRRAR
jgi:shikimate kinase